MTQSWILNSVVNESASRLRRKLVSSTVLYSFLQAFALLYSFLQRASHPYTASYTAGWSDNMLYTSHVTRNPHH